MNIAPDIIRCFRVRTIGLFLLACLWFGLAGDIPAAGPSRHVVMISIDGLAAGYLADSMAEMPAIRGLAERGLRAKGMRVSSPSVTVVNHVSLVTGVHPERHGIYANWVLERPNFKKIRFIPVLGVSGASNLVAETVFDRAYARGLSTAAISWPLTDGANTLTWVLCPAKTQETFEQTSSPGLLAELTAAGLPCEKFGEWSRANKVNELDRLATDTAIHLLRKHAPNLLLLHLTAMDTWQHRFGCYTSEAYRSCRETDAHVGRILQAIAETPLRDSTTVFIVSDHGFTNTKRVLFASAVLREAGLHASVWTASHGGSCHLYIAESSDRPAMRKKLKGLFQSRDEIVAIADHYESEDGEPAQAANEMWRPDLTLFCRTNLSFFDDPRARRFVRTKPWGGGGHGHDPASPSMFATFVAAGAGIRKGGEVDEVQIVDVAPTIARLLGIGFTNSDGRVLSEFLDP